MITSTVLYKGAKEVIRLTYDSFADEAKPLGTQ